VRVLVASTAGAGHFNPLRAFVDCLRARGDDVLLVVPPELEAIVQAAGYPFRVGQSPAVGELAEIWDRVPNVPSDEMAVLVNREIFGRLDTAAMLPAHEAACREWQPDLVLREPCEYASAIAAARHAVPHAQVAISLAGIEASSIGLVEPALAPYGAEVVPGLRESPYLTRFPESIDPSPFIRTLRYRDPGYGRGQPLPDWWRAAAAPLVYVTFGSVTGELPIAEAAYRTALEAVADLPARVLLTVGRALEVAGLGPLPPNVHAEAWVPQQDVLTAAAVVVCHGGSGTTLGALAAGVPVVIAPMFADQPANARRVVELGAGVLVEPRGGPAATMGRFGPGDAARLRAAIESVLADPSYGQAARAVAAELRAQPSVEELLDDLRRLTAARS
jgi:UDP:flavonoid glycosyltransferase YjiC (YdhE family)